jgi:hypothetical protein
MDASRTHCGVDTPPRYCGVDTPPRYCGVDAPEYPTSVILLLLGLESSIGESIDPPSGRIDPPSGPIRGRIVRSTPREPGVSVVREGVPEVFNDGTPWTKHVSDVRIAPGESLLFQVHVRGRIWRTRGVHVAGDP